MDKGDHRSNSSCIPGQGTVQIQVLSLRMDLVEIHSFLFSARIFVILI